MIPLNLTLEQVIADMKSCEQTKGVSVYKHGEMVREYFSDLFAHLVNEPYTLKYHWRFPEWLYDNKDLIINEVFNISEIEEYMLMHDCGKPYCLTVDEEGKNHFPDHANVSYEVYKRICPSATTIQQLIKNDMVVHNLKGDDVENFSRTPLAISLLISALCEIHANASMFGGIESTSFKIKWKQIDRRGRQVFEMMPNT